jgi:hypothetical protein
MDRKKRILKEQSGLSMVIALMMILVLSVIGLAATFNSNLEVQLSGNKRGSTNAFYTADGGAQSVLADLNNFYLSTYSLVPNSSSLAVELRNEDIDSKKTSPSLSMPPGVSFPDPPQVTIYHSSKTKVPRSLGFSAIHFEYNYYIIDSLGRDQIDASSNKANAEVREKIVRILPTAQGGN